MNSSSFQNVLSQQFYLPETWLLNEYRQVKTPASVKESLEVVRKNEFSKSDIWFKPDAVDFVRESYKNRSKVGATAKETPIFGIDKSVYPTLAQLSPAMKDDYFRWRREFLNNMATGANTYHLHIFVGELANYTFNASAAFNLSMLAHLKRIFQQNTMFYEFVCDVLDDLLLEAKGKSNGKAPIYLKMRGETELYYAMERYHIRENGTDASNGSLAKISINTWKNHFEKPRKNQFFKEHRPKIYKVFKECLQVLDEVYRDNGTSLFEMLYSVHEEKKKLPLFADVPAVYRKEKPIVDRTIEVVSFSDEMAPILKNYYRMSENVTRTLQGEKRQLNLDGGVLPDGLFERMIEQMQPKAKDKKVPEPIVFVPVEVKFDDSKISRLKQETDALVQEVEERIEEDTAAAQTTPPPVKAPNTMSLEEFFSKGSESEDTKELVESLADLEKDFLKQFKNDKLDKKTAHVFLKAKGKMLGSVLGQLNEKAQETLGDNLIEEVDGNLEILEEFLGILGQF